VHTSIQLQTTLALRVPEMTYNVFSGTLNPTHFTSRVPYVRNNILNRAKIAIFCP